MNRPIALKKDNIQTRNRKLAAKAKKQRKLAGMSDFFGSNSLLTAAYNGAAAAAGSTAYGSLAGYGTGYNSYAGYPGLSLSPSSAAAAAASAAYHPHHGTASSYMAAAAAAGQAAVSGHHHAMSSMLTPA